jgi:hypothetical protein
MNQEQQSELDSLLSTLLHGELTTQQRDQLRQLLSDHAEARQYYRRYIETKVMLECELGSMTTLPNTNLGAIVEANEEKDEEDEKEGSRNTGIGDNVDENMDGTGISTGLYHLFEYAEATKPDSDEFLLDYAKPSKAGSAGDIEAGSELVAKFRWSKRLRFVASVAAIFILMVLVALLLPAPEPVPVATFSASHEAHFAGEEIAVGEELLAGPRELERGVVQITFATGAEVLIQGPATFELLTENSVRLVQGKLSATVPPETVGFTVRTSQVDIVDLGTEFGVFVAHNGTVLVKVFKGSVETRDIDSDKRTLITANGARRFELDTDEVAVEPFDDADESHAGSFVRDISKHKKSLAKAPTKTSTTSSLAGALLRVDFQNSGNQKIPAATQSGFKAFDNSHVTGNGTASATYATAVGNVTVALAGMDAQLNGLFNRDPGITNTASMTLASLYNDFAFINGSSGQSLTLTLSGPGIEANTDYTMTFYSYDDLESQGSHSVTFAGVGDTSGSAGPLQYRGGATPTRNSQYAVTGTFTSDDAGTLTIRMTDQFLTVPEATGIRLNGFEIK